MDFYQIRNSETINHVSFLQTNLHIDNECSIEQSREERAATRAKPSQPSINERVNGLIRRVKNVP